MNKTTEALKLAEEALLEWKRAGYEFEDDVKALAAIREVLADYSRTPEGCDYCKHPLFAGTKCNNCGRVTFAEPDMNLNCPSVQARLATLWGYVKADHSGDANEMVSEPLQEPVSILDDPAFSVDVEYFEARKQALLNVAAKCDARRWIYLNRLNDMYFMPCENKDEPTNRVVFETTPDEAYDIGFSDGLEVGRKQRGEG